MSESIIKGDRTIKVGFLPLFSITKPSSRYRVFQFLKPLSDAGIQSEILNAPERNPLKRLSYLPRLLPIIAKSDVLYIQKRLLPKPIMFAIKKIKPQTIFDLDDAIFLRDQIREQVNIMIKSASIVVTGNEYLANYAQNYNKNVVIIPTVVDTNYYFPSTANRNSYKKKIIIGWIGMDPNRGDFEMFKPVLDWLGQKFHDRVSIHFVADRPLDYHMRPNVEFVPWRLKSAVSDLQRFDIGIMPIDDTPWNRGKCGLKLIQYMAIGAATVASPVGVNKIITIDGQTGFLASTTKDWKTYLTCLVEDNQLRLQMGQLGRNRIEQSFSINAVLPQLKETLIHASKVEPPE